MITRIVVLLLLSLLSGCSTLRRASPLAPLERSLLYMPAAYPIGDWTPDGLEFQDAWFDSADGTRLHGWYVPHADPVAIALVFHGNAGNISHLSESLRLLNQRHNLSVMTFDYRGYGRSEGKPNEDGILADARAARAWLAQAAQMPESEIVLMGRSLGGGVAVDLAANDGAKGLVLASTFTSLPEVANHHFRWLPTRALMTQRMDSLSKIGNYRGPLLHTHGDADKLIPYAMGQRLHDAAPGRKTFITIPDGGHNSPQTEEYRGALDVFLASLQTVPASAR